MSQFIVVTVLYSTHRPLADNTRVLMGCNKYLTEMMDYLVSKGLDFKVNIVDEDFVRDGLVRSEAEINRALQLSNDSHNYFMKGNNND